MTGPKTGGRSRQRKQNLSATAGMVEALGLPVKMKDTDRAKLAIPPGRALRKSISSPKKWDVFVSHASEDKNELARPLSEALRKKGLSVWYDEYSSARWERNILNRTRSSP